jgi:hypothetical protein
MNMTELVTRVADFIDDDALKTRSEIANAKRRRVSTQEAFRDFRMQVDRFESRILEDYDAVIADSEARLARIEAAPVESPSQPGNVVQITAVS